MSLDPFPETLNGWCFVLFYFSIFSTFSGDLAAQISSHCHWSSGTQMLPPLASVIMMMIIIIMTHRMAITIDVIKRKYIFLK